MLQWMRWWSVSLRTVFSMVFRHVLECVPFCKISRQYKKPYCTRVCTVRGTVRGTSTAVLNLVRNIHTSREHTRVLYFVQIMNFLHSIHDEARRSDKIRL
jgi:hypothetical protein